MLTSTGHDDADLGLLRLLQLSSAALPVGAYSFSQGLEFAIAEDWIGSPEDVENWIAAAAIGTLGSTDVPLLQRLHTAALARDEMLLGKWNDTALALRETRELLEGDVAMGRALVRLLRDLGGWVPTGWHGPGARPSFVSAFALAIVHFGLDARQACTAYAWAWLENQVMAATKLLPMGQTRAQQMLVTLGATLVDEVERGRQLADDEIGMSLPGLASASARHETQYSRLYRS